MYPETGWQILRLFGTASVIAATAQETFVTAMYKNNKLPTPPSYMAEATPSKNHCGVTKVPAQLDTPFPP